MRDVRHRPLPHARGDALTIGRALRRPSAVVAAGNMDLPGGSKGAPLVSIVAARLEPAAHSTGLALAPSSRVRTRPPAVTIGGVPSINEAGA